MKLEDFDLEKGILDAVGELPKNCYEESIAKKKKEEQDVLAASPEIPNYTFYGDTGRSILQGRGVFIPEPGKGKCEASDTCHA